MFIITKQCKAGKFADIQFDDVERAAKAYHNKYILVMYYKRPNGELLPMKSKMNSDKLFSQEGLWKKLERR